MRKKMVFLPYDMDTAVGINNEGSLVFGYSLEDIDQTDGGADVFNGQQSVLWKNVRAAFMPEITALYKQLRQSGALSYDVVERMFEEHQGKWSEAIFNEDAQFKYIDPLIQDGSEAYLPMLQGSKAEQRKWWLYNRFRYLDSKYNAGDALVNPIQIRCYATGDITLTPYADIYAAIKYGSAMVQARAQRNQPITLACPLDQMNDTETYIYSAQQIASVGDLSPLKVGFGDFSSATRLQTLKLGDGDPNYSNGNLTTLYLGNNTLLSTVDVRNCPNLTGAVDLSGCINIAHLYFEGTNIASVSLPNGSTIKTLHLPATLTSLTLQNQSNITDLQIAGYENLTTLRLENMGTHFDTRALVERLPLNSRIRIIGFNWTAEDADEISDLYDLLDRMRGIDEQGNNTAKPQMIGTISVPTLYGEELAGFRERYPDITIDYGTVISYIKYYNYDGSTLLYTEECAAGAAGVYDGAPFRQEDDDGVYAFSGWSKKMGGAADPNAIIGSETGHNVYAAYAITPKFKVRYYTYDAQELLHTEILVGPGQTATYSVGPEREETDQYYFVFNGWATVPNGAADPDAQKNITEDTALYAAYEFVLQTYVVRFYREGVLLKTVLAQYGTTVIYEDDPPAHEDPDLVFTGWLPEPVNITGNTSCYAQYHDTSDMVSQYLKRTITSYDSTTDTRLDDSAFNYCTYLSSVKTAATDITAGAFRGCSALREVELRKNVRIPAYMFVTCTYMNKLVLSDNAVYTLASVSALEDTQIGHDNGTVYVPAALVAAYRSDTNWSNFDIQAIS